MLLLLLGSLWLLVSLKAYVRTYLDPSRDHGGNFNVEIGTGENASIRVGMIRTICVLTKIDWILIQTELHCRKIDRYKTASRSFHSTCAQNVRK